MTKQELMETYTAEQLAEMVVKLQSTSEVKNDEIHKLKWQISSMEEENGRLQAKFDTYNNYLLTRATKEAKEMIDHNNFGEVMIVTCEQWNNRIEKESNEADIRRYEDTIDKLQSEVEKYRKAFENAKKERDCQIAEYQKKIEELENHHKFSMMQIDDVLVEFLGVTHGVMDRPRDFEKVLQEVIDMSKNVSDFLPTEPINVADMLIKAEGEYEHNPVAKALYGEHKGTYRIFDISELRQIAEHLLVYCNHNGRRRNEYCENN